MRKTLLIAAVLLGAGLGFRLFLALHLPNDEPDDGRLYARIALNIIDHRSFSIEREEPYKPTYIRMPGYPLFVAGCYRLFGRDNNRAVRITQAVLDTVTCLLVGLLAWAWLPRKWSREQKRRAMLIATALAAACPFTAIYPATILTETSATLLVTASALMATFAMRAGERSKKIGLWVGAGVSCGLATMFRPDAGLFVASIGVALVAVGITRAIRKSGCQPNNAPSLKTGLISTAVSGIALALGFAAALAPWTIRNERVFGVFQPIAPARANMPEDFVAHGYIRWLKTWIDDSRYVEPFQWALDERRINVDRLPGYACDSQEERDQVAQLFARYNGPVPAPPVKPPPPDEKRDGEQAEPDDEQAQGDDDQAQGDDEQAEPDDEQGQSEDDEEEAAEESSAQPDGMTPELDAEFGKLAAERIVRKPLRYYVVLPAKRAASMWFDTHSQYYPFEGSLFPLAALDRDRHQQYWLPVFAAIDWAYTLLALTGCWLLWRNRDCRQWLVLFSMLIAPRVALLSTLENPEPRYVVELFSFVAAVAAFTLAALANQLFKPKPSR